MLVLKDFSTSILAASLSDTATSIVVGDAGRFPSLPAGSYFYAVLQKFADRHQVEIVKVVGANGNMFSVERAQAGTTAKHFSVGDYIELRLTVATFDEYVRQSVSGKLDSAYGVVYQTLLFENAGDGVRSSFGVRFSDHHETVIGGAEGVNAVAPSLHLRPLGRDNKTVEALYTHDGVFRLVGGASEIAARRIILNSPDATGWPSGAASSADNYARQWRSVVQANNSSLYLVGDGTLNARRFGFQVGNADPALSHEIGVLELNPYGGDVRVNGGSVYHTNYRPTPAAIGALPAASVGSFVELAPFSLSLAANRGSGGSIGGWARQFTVSGGLLDSDKFNVGAYGYDAAVGYGFLGIGGGGAFFDSPNTLRVHRDYASWGTYRLYHEGYLPTPAVIGAYPLKGGQLDGFMLAKSYVVAESHDGRNWVGIEASDGDAKPYISAKVNNVARKVMEFNFDGSISLPTTLHAQRINAAVWGDVFNAIGGTLRSDNAAVMSLDGKTYSFVTSPADAHLCQNSYWDGAEWRKYDVNSASGYLAITNGVLKFITSDAGVVDPRQRLEFVYHTGRKPTPSEIGALPIAGGEMGGVVTFRGSANLLNVIEGAKIRYFNGDSTWFYTSVNATGEFEISTGGLGETSIATVDYTGKIRTSRQGVLYGDRSKPTSEELGVIGVNKKNYLNNAGKLGVGFISADEQGEGWVASYYGTDTGTKVVMGSLGGLATIGAHSPSMNEWADLHINSQDGVAGVPKATIIGNPFAKNSGDTTVYRVYHEGYMPTAHGIGAAPAGFGVGGYCATIGTVLGDCDLRRQGGFFHGSLVEGIPAEGHTWKYIINACHANPAGYFGYIAIDFDLGHAWLGGQSGGVPKQKKFVFQTDRFIAAGATGNDYYNSSIEVSGSGGSVKPTIGFHQLSEFAASIGLWSGDQFRFHTQGVGDYAGIMTGLANVSDIYIRSDVRLKTNFVEMRGALDKLSLLQAYYYDKKGMLSSDDYNAHELGLKAQDVEAVEPVAVRRVEDSSGGEILSISGSAINAMLVQAINELRIRVEELERHARS